MNPARGLPSNPLSRQERWLIAGVMLAMALGCLMLTAVVGADLAIRRGALTGPDVNLRLGSVRVVAVTNEYPDCSPPPEGCPVYFSEPLAGRSRYYTVWVETQLQKAGPGGMPDQIGSQRLLKIQTLP